MYFKNCGNTSTSGSLLPRTKKEEFFIKQIPFVLWAKKAFFFGWMVDDFADKFIVIYYLIFGPRSKEKGLLHT
jgi:hypothetical protein